MMLLSVGLCVNFVSGVLYQDQQLNDFAVSSLDLVNGPLITGPSSF